MFEKKTTPPPFVPSYDPDANVLIYTPAGSPFPPAPLAPAAVRRADTSAKAIDEWTGAPRADAPAVPDDVRPTGVQAVGNYAAQITWEDGFSQVSERARERRGRGGRQLSSSIAASLPCDSLSRLLSPLSQIAPFDQLDALADEARLAAARGGGGAAAAVAAE